MVTSKKSNKQNKFYLLFAILMITGIWQFEMPVAYAKEDEKPFILSQEEEAYINENHTICIGVYADDYPLSSVEPKSGKMTGITIEILNLLQSTSGITFTIIPIEENIEPLKLLKDKKYDLIAGIPYHWTYRSDDTITMTNPFITEEIVAVGKKGKQYKSNEELKIAIPRMYDTLAGSIKQYFPSCSIFVYADNDACMEAVVYQKVDVMLQNTYVANYFLQKPFYDSLEIIPTYSFCADMSIAGIKSEDPRIFSILNKAIASLNQDEINQVVIDHTISNPYKLAWGDWVYKYAKSICAIALLCGICVLIVFEAYHERKIHRRKEQQLMHQSEIDAMTGLYNKVTMENLCECRINENKAKEYCLFIIDIDNFKQINDTYGHQSGDDVLCTIGQELKKAFVGNNLVGRIGGDEFAALYNVTDNKKRPEEIANNLCENLQVLQNRIPLSCSIGMAKVPDDGVVFSELFQKADTALYDVKKNGKNGFKVSEQN